MSKQTGQAFVPERTNRDRARAADRAFKMYSYCRDEYPAHPNDVRDAFTDLVTDLLHLAYRDRIPFSTPELAYAYEHYLHECDEAPSLPAETFTGGGS